MTSRTGAPAGPSSELFALPPSMASIPDLFGFDPLPAAILAASVAIVITYVATTEALVFYRRLAKRT